MARVIGEALVRVKPDTKGLATQVGRETESGLKSQMGKIGALAGAALGVAVVGGLRQSINAARDLGETQSAVKAIFGESATAVEAFATKAAKSLGQSRTEALNAANTFATFGKSAGLAGDNLVTFSTDMVTLASDLASFKNTSPEEAINAIGGALRGETEPIRKYGVLLDAASISQQALKMGLIKTTKDALTPQQKVLAVQALIMKQTTDAQGDFAKTSGGLANQQRILKAQLTDVSATVGKALLPLMVKLANALRSVVTFVQENHKWLVPLVAVLATFAAVIVTTNAVTSAFVAIQAASAALHLGTAVRVIGHTAALIAHKTAALAIAAATKVWMGVQILMNLVLTANPIGIVVVAIAALVAGIIIAYKNSETFRKIVQATWAGIRVAISFVVKWFMTVVLPSLKRAWADLQVAVKFLATYISANFNFWKGVVLGVIRIVNNVLSGLKKWFTVTIPNAVKTFASAVAKGWQSLVDMAKKPVRFVIQTVINQGIIGTFNKVSGFFHGPKFKSVPMPAGMGDGHGIAGHGAGDGLGMKDVLKLFTGPAKWLSEKVGIGRITSKFGNNPFAQLLVGSAGALKDAALDRVMEFISGSSDIGGGGAGTGGLQPGILRVLGALRGAFGNVGLISGFRRGARTLNNSLSYHGFGRAIDIKPVLAHAVMLNAVFGRSLRELITPWNSLNILNGRPHRYTGAVWNQHNFAGGNAHIHAAADHERGVTLLPGMNLVPNGLGRPETFLGANELRKLRLHPDDMDMLARTIAKAFVTVMPRGAGFVDAAIGSFAGLSARSPY